MKLSHAILAWSAFFSTSAMAQSVGVIPQDSAATGPTRVVLFGVADVGLESIHNGHTITRVSSGIAAGSRWGIRGTEDLGGGFRAVFVLESRLEIDTGATGNTTTYLPPAPAAPPGVSDAIWVPTWNNLLTKATTVNGDNALFDRQSFVGFITPAGGVLVGRMYTPGYEIMNAFNVYGDATAGQFGQGFSALAVRVSNAIAYRLATETQGGKLTGTLMYSVGGIDGVNGRAERAAGTGSSGDDYYGANLRYTTDWWDVGVGYNRHNTYRFASPTSGTIVGSQRGLATLNLGGSVRLGNARLFAMVMNRNNDNPIVRISAHGSTASDFAALAARSSLLSFQDADLVVGQAEAIDTRVYHLGFAYRLGAGTFTAGLNRADDRRAAYNADVNHYSVGYFHELSKRTTLYSVLALAHNQNSARMGLGGAGFSGGFTQEFGQNARALQLGLRHVF